MKIRPVGIELFNAGGRTDERTDGQAGRQRVVTKLRVAFRDLANAPKNGMYLPCYITGSTVYFMYQSIFFPCRNSP
jgi:hypothetical protein